RDPGILDLEAYQKLLNEKTRIVAVAHASNTLGTVNPVREIVQIAHARNIPVLIDGAQAVQHIPIDVQELDCDFYVFSGHKIYGPTGTGVLYGKERWLEELPPWQGGGEMVECVHFDHTDYAEVPLKFEAGTPNIAGVIGLGEALRFLQKTGWNDIRRYEEELSQYARTKLAEMEEIRFFGDAPGKIAIFSFLIGNLHPYDTGMILDKLGIAVRTGMHCAQPVMDHYGIEGTVRASLVFYNTTEEVDRLCEGIRKAVTVLSH
ncbi:MAG: cysteine desulfurase, partial [Bacteroidales bacterium]|nr:cysteine desulfurase [Bacteroidales bacterium]